MMFWQFKQWILNNKNKSWRYSSQSVDSGQPMDNPENEDEDALSSFSVGGRSVVEVPVFSW